MNLPGIVKTLEGEKINTWFDLGLFLDHFREGCQVPKQGFKGSYQEFCTYLSTGGIAILGFDVDSIGWVRHTDLFSQGIATTLSSTPIYDITGDGQLPEHEPASMSSNHYQIPGVGVFDDWLLFRFFFHEKINRGSQIYNQGIVDFWNELRSITQSLGRYLSEHNIRLLIDVDICSLPGNIALTLAFVLLSEYLNIPVINLNRNFYWEAEAFLNTDQQRVLQIEKNAHLGELTTLIEVLFPWESRSWRHITQSSATSEALIMEKGISPANIEAMTLPNGSKNLKYDWNILHRLYIQISTNGSPIIDLKNTVKTYAKNCRTHTTDLEAILPNQNRQYLPGYGKTGFMLYLKSLIDPSFFRVEEQHLRGAIYRFARKIVQQNVPRDALDSKTLTDFYNAISDLFLLQEGEEEIRHDHSFSYRHRNRIRYLYRDFSHQELTGLVNILAHQILPIEIDNPIEPNQNNALGWDACLQVLTKDAELVIDDRDYLIAKLKGDSPVAYFPGENWFTGIEAFVLHPLRMRLGTPSKRETLFLEENIRPRAYIFCPERTCLRRINVTELQQYIDQNPDSELAWLLETGYCQIVPTQQWSVGIHFPQLGDEALAILKEVSHADGLLITDDWDAAVMTDIVDIDRFHIGVVKDILTAKIMGIPVESGYVQYLPASVRATLAYPTPIQTAYDFHKALNSSKFTKLCQRYSRENLENKIRRDAKINNIPLKTLLSSLDESLEITDQPMLVEISHINGLYPDGQPWNGSLVKAKLDQPGQKIDFSIVFKNGKTEKVTNFVDEFQVKTHQQSLLAWNGGYSLNNELVGKLGLPESYIGSPLGLIISNGEILCPPLFHRPAFLVSPDGRVNIKRVNCAGGIALFDDTHFINLGPLQRNPKTPPPDEVCFYDLMFPDELIDCRDRIILRLVGNIIQDILHPTNNQRVAIFPVGLTISFPKVKFPPSWNQPGKRLEIKMTGWGDVHQAIEAGPLLVDNGQVCIDMKAGGWKTPNSIRTQAARIDYTDMRGPKIATGLDAAGNLVVLAINGRIRESVGASHEDMAQILISNGAVTGMGFDPGGSSTLVVNGEIINISPYNPDYETDIYALPPVPRGVASAVIGYIKKVSTQPIGGGGHTPTTAS
jgi:hypothetical protein